MRWPILNRRLAGAAEFDLTITWPANLSVLEFLVGLLILAVVLSRLLSVVQK
jgi:hypothetical protein